MARIITRVHVWSCYVEKANSARSGKILRLNVGSGAHVEGSMNVPAAPTSSLTEAWLLRVKALLLHLECIILRLLYRLLVTMFPAP
jgi:hypothetical protein